MSRRLRNDSQSAPLARTSTRNFPAAWLVPIVKNKWIRLEDRRTSRLTARSLARLVSQSDWPTDLLSNSRVVALLGALRIRAPELSMEIAAGDNNLEALDETLSILFTGVGHDLNRLGDLASGHSRRPATV